MYSSFFLSSREVHDNENNKIQPSQKVHEFLPFQSRKHLGALKSLWYRLKRTLTIRCFMFEI